ncbi:MAG: hypothetical protein IID37_05545 [Planctomycetes bacterium]|nr:hypothetical protein [Planctomycetota bacterium]
MKRFRSFAALLLAMAGLSGCGPPIRHGLRSEAPRVALLFDHLPGRPSASQIVHRSDWPSTFRSWSVGEVVEYREQVYDYQNGGRNSGDQFRRYFRSTRVGRSHR